MKKALFGILLVMSCMVMTSCVTAVHAQDDVYQAEAVVDVDNIEVAITYGTPYIVGGNVLYYLYNNLYYYPFYTGGYYYYRVYSRPLYRYPSYWRPFPRSHWFREGRFHRPHGGFHGTHRGHGPARPHGNIHNRPGHHVDHVRGNRPGPGTIRGGARPRAGEINSSTGTTIRHRPSVAPRVNNGAMRGGRISAPSRPGGMIRGGSHPGISRPSGGTPRHFGGRK